MATPRSTRPAATSLGERSDIVRIVVVEAQALRTKIDNLMASRPELDDQFLLQAISAVISGDADAHIGVSCINLL
jgi:hypothetical protein